MQVKVTNTSRHLATAIEVFASQTTAPGPGAPDAPAHSISQPQPQPQRLPCVTANSLNLQQLPHRCHVALGPSLEPARAQRAFLIRSGDADWAVLTGTLSFFLCSFLPLFLSSFLQNVRGV